MNFVEFKTNEPIALHTTFRCGGPAKLFLQTASEKDICEAVRDCAESKIDWRILGDGSNVLASDNAIDKAIFAYNSGSDFTLHEDGLLEISGACELQTLVEICATNALDGTDNLAGIPGTVAGAITGNAGAYGTAISDNLVSCRLFSPLRGIHIAKKNELNFSYRNSSIKNGKEVLLSALFKFSCGDRIKIRDVIEEKLADRRQKHPDWKDYPTAGSFFKNPDDIHGKRLSAGKLLEDAGCKELSVGNARPWHKHANIIVCTGPATSTEIRKLASIMQARVMEKFGIMLEPEVFYLD